MMEAIKDIIADMRRGMIPKHRHDRELLQHFADRIEAARKREADSIHHAMVLIAGIEIENSKNPPRLWTALEDAYNALCDALGTDGETTADVEEAKATGRHFIVKPYGNAANMREAAGKILWCLEWMFNNTGDESVRIHLGEPIALAEAALSAPARNCGLYEKEDDAWEAFCKIHPDAKCPDEYWSEQYQTWLFEQAKGE